MDATINTVDTAGNPGSASITETVAINNAPVLTVNDLGAVEDGPTVSGTPTFSDDIGDVHTYTVTPLAPGQGSVSIDSNTGVYTFDPGADFQSLAQGATAMVTFDVMITDNNGASDTETVTVTITGANDAPIAQDDAITAIEDTPFNSVVDLDFNDSDIDGDTLSVVAGTFANY